MKAIHLILFSMIASFHISSSFAQQKEVKIFAHRGGAYEYDENTMYAFEESYKQGARGFELDIRLTKDNRLVLIHDPSMKRTVGIDKPIEELTLREVKKLRTLKGNPIPTLEEAVAFFKDKRGLYVEFEMKTQKPLYDEAMLKLYCDQVYRKVYESVPSGSTYVLTSFDKRPLSYLRANHPSATVVLLKSTGLSDELMAEAKELNIDRIGCRLEGTTRDMIKKAKDQGFKITLWPGRSVEDFLLGVMLEPEALCTDVPVAVMTWVKANAPWITIK